MKSPHLSDTDIQQYALDKVTAEMRITSHLQGCNFCREKVQLYEILFAGINAQPKSDFNFDLSAMVLSKLQPEPKFSWIIFWVYLFAFTGIAFCCIVFYLLSDNIFNMLSSIPTVALYLLLITALAILIFQNVESYKKYQRKMDQLKFY